MISNLPTPLSRRPAATTILLVEDDQPLREALTEALQYMGYTIHDAASGAEALLLAQAINGKHFDLVISDLVMQGMNALELYDALKLETYGGRMLVITGYPMPHTGLSLVERPGVRWAAKPIGVDALHSVIDQMLGA